MDIVSPAISLATRKTSTERYTAYGDHLQSQMKQYNALPKPLQKVMSSVVNVFSTLSLVVALVTLALAVYLAINAYKGKVGTQIGMTLFALFLPGIYLLYHVIYHDIYKHPNTL
jgi:amino acid transporter